MLIHSWAHLCELVGKRGACVSFWALIVVFCGVEGSEESRWPTPRCGHGRGQLFFCLRGWDFAIIVWHKQALEAVWDNWLERQGVGVGSPLSGPSHQGQSEAANDSMAAGSRSCTLVSISISTLSSPFFSLSLAVCEKYVPCGLVGVLNDGCLSEAR